MHISKKQFLLITFFFLLIPISINWKLLIFGERTTGVVIEQLTQYSRNIKNTIDGSTFSSIRFVANEKAITFNAPENVKYKKGEKVTIIYNRKKPSDFVLFTFAGLVLSNKMIVPAVILLIWFAFYLSVNQTHQKNNLVKRNRPSRRSK